MDEHDTLTVGSVARLAGVTVRTLHHYDEVGLLAPSGRSDAGYRRYADADLDRLQRILFYRELGFALDEIRTVMTDGGNAIGHLRVAAGRAHEQQRRDIDTFNDEDQTCGCEQGPEYPTATTHNRVEQWLDDDAHRCVVVREVRRHTLMDDGQLRQGLIERHTRRQSAEELELRESVCQSWLAGKRPNAHASVRTQKG